jgi:hypothetical protein
MLFLSQSLLRALPFLMFRYLALSASSLLSSSSKLSAASLSFPKS